MLLTEEFKLTSPVRKGKLCILFISINNRPSVLFPVYYFKHQPLTTVSLNLGNLPKWENKTFSKIEDTEYRICYKRLQNIKFEPCQTFYRSNDKDCIGHWATNQAIN